MTQRHAYDRSGCLAIFLVSAATMTVVIEHPASPVRSFVGDAITRRMLMGMAMGLTAATIIYSPWGAAPEHT